MEGREPDVLVRIWAEERELRFVDGREDEGVDLRFGFEVEFEGE